MEPRALAIASEFCKLVDTADLLEYLGLPHDVSVEEAKEALAKRRKRMQSMQSNPKFKDSARFLIKNFRTLEQVIEDPAAHLEYARREREDAKLPMLELALNGALADKHLSAAEEAFLRTAAIELGISVERYEQVLAERAAEVGATIESDQPRSGPSVDGETIGVDEETTTNVQGAKRHGWWNANFTRLLLESIPGGPGELVDVYCRTALGAITLLPERRQLSYLGVDKSAERLEDALKDIKQAGIAGASSRISLTVGEPHKLPIPDESVDFVLCVRALSNVHDTKPVFDEAFRVLRPGGRMLVAEPDGLAETFYFEGHLDRYNSAFHDLLMEIDRIRGRGGHDLRRPGLAVGPTLPGRLELSGLETVTVEVHAAPKLRMRNFEAMARNLRKYPKALAASAGLDRSPLLARVLAEVMRLETQHHNDYRGLSGNVLPMFLVVAAKPDEVTEV